MSWTASLKAPSFAFDGFVVPAILRTYCKAASCTSEPVAGGSKLWSWRMFLHMPSLCSAREAHERSGNAETDNFHAYSITKTLDREHRYLLRVRRKSMEITDVAGQHSAIGLGQSNNQRVDRRSLRRSSAELGRSTRQGQRH